MARDRTGNGAPPETVISIIGPGMQVTGELQTDGTIRIEGTVTGTVRAGKAVVVGREGVVEGDVYTQDAVISGRVNGVLVAESRLELQATCRIEGDVRARRMQLEEGAILNGSVQMGETFREPAPAPPRIASPEHDGAEHSPREHPAGEAHPTGFGSGY